MAKKAPSYQVPYNKHGHLCHYPESWDKGIKFVDNEPFFATLKLTGMESGRSAKYVVWTEPTTKRTFPMFVRDLLDMLETSTVTNGIVSGNWIVRKRGCNYGVAKHNG